MKTDPKLARSQDAIDADYRAFGLTRMEGLARLGRSTTFRQRHLIRLGAQVDPKTGRVGPHVTHRAFAKVDLEFQVACENAGIQPTARQASKWRRRIGKAYTAHVAQRRAS